MDLDAKIKKQLSERIMLNFNFKNPEKIHLENSGVDFFANPVYLPVFLEPVDIKEIIPFRKRLEEYLDANIGFVYYWNYDRDDKNEYDGIVDLIKVNLNANLQASQRQASQKAVITYHTISNEAFLKEFLPRATEFHLATQVWNPYGNALEMLEEKIDLFLKNHYGVSYNEYKKLAHSKPDYYQARPEYEFKKDFLDYTLIYLGTLSAIPQTSPKEFFSRIKDLKISPIKRRPEQPIFSFIQDSLNKFKV